MNLFLFLIQVFILSLSGVMAPGPVTTTTIAIGARNRWAGTLVATGHGIIEFPLMVLIMLGFDKILKFPQTQIIIGLVGGALLIFMAIQMLVGLKNQAELQDRPANDKPILAGIVLSAGNPYFLIWWATIGLTLATRARELGVWAFGLFAITHWLCDCGWLQLLSWASFKGSVLLGRRGRRIILSICAAALLVFGLKFGYDSAQGLIEILQKTN